jgi:hypothetical protein
VAQTVTASPSERSGNPRLRLCGAPPLGDHAEPVIRYSSAALILLVCLLPLLAAADEPPRLRVVRVDEGPEIDGQLDDPVWERAAVIDRLIQAEPQQGAPISERTEIRVLSDLDNLYFGIRSYDRQPERIIAQKMLRDDSLLSEDRIAIALDTFHDRRNGYLFEVNALGSMLDALIENGEFDGNWDGIWYAKARIDDEGWILEMAIPYKTVSFAPDGDTWGMNILRVIRRHDERARWADPYPQKSFLNMKDAGTLEGMRGIRQGLGLDVVPGAALRHVDDPAEDRSFTTLEPSLDAFYKLLPSITAALTVNTDFAETAVDERRLNLTRFDLFFPEKRDFFLQDAGIFEFGGLQDNGRPFFSRRIGLDEEGEPYDILVGGKVTGRANRLNIGVLDTYVEEHDGVDAQNLFVSRFSANVLGESQVGVIATSGDPLSNEDNHLAGGDFFYRNSNVRDNQVLIGRLWYQRSFTPGLDGQENAFGGLLEYPNDIVRWRLGFSEIQENFFPALGFVNRTDIRQYEANFRYRIRREGFLRTIDTKVWSSLVTDTDNDVESASVTYDFLELKSERDDEIELFWRFGYEQLDEDFEIHPDVVIPPGRYQWHRGGIEAEVGETRPLSGRVGVAYGGFFDGTRLRVEALLRWRPSAHLLFSAEYIQNEVDVTDEHFHTRIARVRMNVNFTPDLSWNTFAQYDNLTDTIGINSRVRWIVTPGSELFLVFNQDLLANDWDITRGRTEPVAKLVWTFRF